MFLVTFRTANVSQFTVIAGLCEFSKCNLRTIVILANLLRFANWKLWVVVLRYRMKPKKWLGGGEAFEPLSDRGIGIRA
jgi:hypothetical protein